jgi:CDP-paratose 2-epimerase
VGLLKKVVGKSPHISFAEWRHADQRVYISDISKAEEMLRWHPDVALDDNVGRLAKWVLKNITLFQ